MSNKSRYLAIASHPHSGGFGAVAMGPRLMDVDRIASQQAGTGIVVSYVIDRKSNRWFKAYRYPENRPMWMRSKLAPEFLTPFFSTPAKEIS